VQIAIWSGAAGVVAVLAGVVAVLAAGRGFH
jgi:hypothetical protein